MNNRYKYSQTWFLGSEIRNKLQNYLDKSKENTMLEIGCFEGCLEGCLVGCEVGCRVGCLVGCEVG